MTGANSLDQLLQKIAACDICAAHLPLGPRPVVRLKPSARLVIIGQAPGTRVHKTGIPWNDSSGDRLRDWLGIDRDAFYDSPHIAIMPMGFCYPGRANSGGDNPPRPECALAWHEQALAVMPEIEMTLLVGQYAQKHYLGVKRQNTMTATVEHWRDYLPQVLPTPHPSWRTTGWLKKNPWFEQVVVPYLRAQVRSYSP